MTIVIYSYYILRNLCLFILFCNYVIDINFINSIKVLYYVNKLMMFLCTNLRLYDMMKLVVV